MDARLFAYVLDHAEADRGIIAQGEAHGLRSDYGTPVASFPDPLGVRWLRFRAACARAEMARTDDPEMLAYLHARACQADAEAAARDRSRHVPELAAAGFLPVRTAA